MSPTHFLPLLLLYFAITLWKKSTTCCIPVRAQWFNYHFSVKVICVEEDKTRNSNIITFTSSNCNIRWCTHFGPKYLRHWCWALLIYDFYCVFPFRPVKPIVLGTVGGQKRAAGQPGIWTTWPWGLALRASFALPSTLYGCILGNWILHYFFFPCKEQHHPSFFPEILSLNSPEMKKKCIGKTEGREDGKSMSSFTPVVTVEAFGSYSWTITFQTRDKKYFFADDDSFQAITIF